MRQKLANLNVRFCPTAKSVINSVICSEHCGAGTVQCITNDLSQLSENPKFEESAIAVKELSDTLDFIAKEAYGFYKDTFYAENTADNICAAVIGKHPELISSFDRGGYVGNRLESAIGGWPQDLKRQDAEKNFGLSQNITEAKERVMTHLKERHPNTTEETIKAKAKINHLKGNIKTSKLIGKDITD